MAFATTPLRGTGSSGTGATRLFRRPHLFDRARQQFFHGAANLMVGLLDAPEIRALASERVLASTTPLQRWAEPVDVAKSIAFLVLDSGYLTGQMLIMDGGLTAGINGS